MPQTVRIDPPEVIVGWRARRDLGDVDELGESIAADGQLQPGLVRRAPGGKFELVAGERRLRACAAAGVPFEAKVLPAGDESTALWLQIVENTRRKDFSVLELGEGLKRWRELYAKDHPDARHGGDHVSSKFREQELAPGRAEGFTRYAAGRLGVSATVVSDAIQLAERLPESRKRELREVASPRERARQERQALSDMRRERRVRRLADSARGAASDPAGRIDLGAMERWLVKYAELGLAFDIVLTDPPYGVEWSRLSGTSGCSRVQLRGELVWDKLDMGWVARVVPVLAKNATVISFCPAEAVGFYALAFRSAGLEYRGFKVWWKTNPPPQHRPGDIQATEHIVWATRGRSTFVPYENAGAEEAHNVIRGPACGGAERLDHPTQKPEWLVERLLRRHSIAGQRVLDPFCGVGTTPVVARRLGLSAAGVELDPRYFDQARDRLRAATQ